MEQLTFIKELELVINRHSKENQSDTPDFMLAEYLKNCLDAYATVVTKRDKWFGIEDMWAFKRISKERKNEV